MQNIESATVSLTAPEKQIVEDIDECPPFLTSSADQANDAKRGVAATQRCSGNARTTVGLEIAIERRTGACLHGDLSAAASPGPSRSNTLENR